LSVLAFCCDPTANNAITRYDSQHKHNEPAWASHCDYTEHRQEQGDYRESWQPQAMSTQAWQNAQSIAKQVTDAIGGLGLFGVELFVQGDQVWFSEVSPRPHDTGMVTLVTQRQNEFELHARAILGLPVSTQLHSVGASAVILGGIEADAVTYSGLEKALADPDVSVRLFGKPQSFTHRRMGVALATATTIDNARKKACDAATQITLNAHP
jgi:phosphoribosylglycinamide formyltransferase 2